MERQMRQNNGVLRLTPGFRVLRFLKRNVLMNIINFSLKRNDLMNIVKLIISDIGKNRHCNAQ